MASCKEACLRYKEIVLMSDWVSGWDMYRRNQQVLVGMESHLGNTCNTGDSAHWPRGLRRC